MMKNIMEVSYAIKYDLKSGKGLSSYNGGQNTTVPIKNVNIYDLLTCILQTNIPGFDLVIRFQVMLYFQCSAQTVILRHQQKTSECPKGVWKYNA